MILIVPSALATHSFVWAAGYWTEDTPITRTATQAFCPECEWWGPDRAGDPHGLQLAELDAIDHLHAVAAQKGIYAGEICRSDRCADCSRVEFAYQHHRDRLRNNGYCYACGRDLRLPYKGTCGHCDPCPENLDGIA
jgi:hypothetical protein